MNQEETTLVVLGNLRITRNRNTNLLEGGFHFGISLEVVLVAEEQQVVRHAVLARKHEFHVGSLVRDDGGKELEGDPFLEFAHRELYESAVLGESTSIVDDRLASSVNVHLVHGDLNLRVADHDEGVEVQKDARGLAVVLVLLRALLVHVCDERGEAAAHVALDLLIRRHLDETGLQTLLDEELDFAGG